MKERVLKHFFIYKRIHNFDRGINNKNTILLNQSIATYISLFYVLKWSMLCISWNLEKNKMQEKNTQMEYENISKFRLNV